MIQVSLSFLLNDKLFQMMCIPSKDLHFFFNLEFVEATLNAHNVYRSVHDVQPLFLDKKLIKHAKQRADDFASKFFF